MNRTIPCALAAAALLSTPFTVAAQDAAAPPDYVSRAEYDKLKAEHEAMKKEMEALKTAVRQMANGTAPAAPAEGPAPANAAAEDKQVVSTTTSQAATDELR
ncbi:MAG: hypothetical protein ABJB22_05300, partial [Verrucomicrobiota bacterium]